MESISKSSTQIRIATNSKDTCSRVLLAEAHSTRDETSKRTPDAQDRNFKSKRPCGNHKKRAVGATGGKTTMEGEARTISARLRNPELWEVFRREETEMIITKAGRYVGFLVYMFFGEIRFVSINHPNTINSTVRKKHGQLNFKQLRLFSVGLCDNYLLEFNFG